MSTYPIIFLHTGNPAFLATAIERAALHNDTEIILLGDESNKHIKGVSHYQVKDFFTKAQEFEDKYYIHMSSNAYGFELICYQRWFVLEEFIALKGYEKFWYIDSDVLVYDNLSTYLNTIPEGTSYDLVGFDTQNCGQGDSFMPAFNLYAATLIAEITRFFKDSYTDPEIFKVLTDKWKRHASQKIKGGICDMSQLKLFFDYNRGKYRIYNSYNLSNSYIPDGNINVELNYTPDNQKFKMLHGKKHVFVENYKAYGYLTSGQQVQFIASHFQGKEGKPSMSYYAQAHYNPNTNLNKWRYKFGNLALQALQPVKRKVRSLLS